MQVHIKFAIMAFIYIYILYVDIYTFTEPKIKKQHISLNLTCFLTTCFDIHSDIYTDNNPHMHSDAYTDTNSDINSDMSSEYADMCLDIYIS